MLKYKEKLQTFCLDFSACDRITEKGITSLLKVIMRELCNLKELRLNFYQASNKEVVLQSGINMILGDSYQSKSIKEINA